MREKYLALAKVKVLVISIALLSLLILAGCSKEKTITTTGMTTIKVQPDEAVTYVVVETSANTAEASKNKNSEITEKVYAALYKISVPRENIETQYYNIYEDIDWSNGTRKLLGYKTTHSIKITVMDFNLIGRIVDETIDAGASRIDGINFDLSDSKQREVKKQALADASKDAREKAEAIVSGIGARLGSVVSISDVNYNYIPYPLYERASMGAEALDKAVTQISPQKLEVTAQVQVVYNVR